MNHAVAPLRLSLAIALGLPLVACSAWPPTSSSTGSSGTSSAAQPQTDPPVIVSLNMTASALTPVNDQYTVYGQITYSDDDDVVTTINVYVPVVGHTYSFPQPQPYQSDVYGAYFSFPLSADPPLGGAGQTTYEVTLVNASGAVSQASIQHADLE